MKATSSTLDYTFRAKNIRNEPRVNQVVPKKTLLKEFAAEIEQLKSDLAATRQRNGIYLTQETYDGMTTESESRRILVQEQRDKIETLEYNLRNKDQELFTLTVNFNSLKKDSEKVKYTLGDTRSILEEKGAMLVNTKRNLEEEVHVRNQPEKTEEQLLRLGQNLISTLGQTTIDIEGLHSKFRRTSEFYSANRQHWSDTQIGLFRVTAHAGDRLQDFEEKQRALAERISSRIRIFVQDELGKLEAAKAELQAQSASFSKSHSNVTTQAARFREQLRSEFEEAPVLRDAVKQEVDKGSR